MACSDVDRGRASCDNSNHARHRLPCVLPCQGASLLSVVLFVAVAKEESEFPARTRTSMASAHEAAAADTTVENELKAKRNDHKQRMERVKEREEALKVQRAELQEELVQFYKFIQDNELKKNRAMKKANSEEKAKEDRYNKIVELSKYMAEQEELKQQKRKEYLCYKKYAAYLDDVLAKSESANEEYREANDIILRWKTLDDNRNVLQRRQAVLEEEVGKRKNELKMMLDRKVQEEMEMQNQVSDKQSELEALQKRYKEAQEQLESAVEANSTTTKTIGQVEMACDNLYDTCKRDVYEHYKVSRASVKLVERKEGKKSGLDIIPKLVLIGECLEDCQEIIEQWKEKKKKK